MQKKVLKGDSPTLSVICLTENTSLGKVWIMSFPFLCLTGFNSWHVLKNQQGRY